ncbi:MULTISPECIES: NnrS family protein [Campylobacter]|uniref:NnrS family protein n=1 Tax=Campylobacter TaxID=194 RepID=UPI00027A36FF|nr:MULTISPECIES: NnrS family protein [Campylobacter]EJP74735.1 NnrS protein [Campylobacter sp. FOBRC14]
MINDFFTHPMRIFFLSSVFCVVLGCISFFVAGDFVSFHKFAFLGLVCPLAYGGFLFTAVPDWTNFPGDLKKHSVAMFTLFVLSLVAMFLDLKFGYFFMGCFWLYLSVFSLVLIIRDRNDQNFSVASILIAFCAFDFLYVFSGDEKFLNAQIHLNMIAILVVSFRVSIVMAKEAFKLEPDMNEAVFAPSFVYKNLAISAFVLLIAALLLDASSQIVGFLALGCGFILLARLSEWHHLCLLRHHFVIFYYLISLFSGVGYVWLGASEILDLALSSNAIHLIALCVVMGVIMLIFNVAGLRHSGQELVFLRLSRLGLVLLFAAGISRSVLAIFSDKFYIGVPAVLFAVSFMLWAINFYAIFRDNEFTEDPE